MSSLQRSQQGIPAAVPRGLARSSLPRLTMARRWRGFVIMMNATVITRCILLVLGIVLLAVVWHYATVLPATMPGPAMGMITLLALGALLLLVAIWVG